MPNDAGQAGGGGPGVSQGRSRFLQAPGVTPGYSIATPAGKFSPADFAVYLRQNFEYDPLGFVEFSYPWGEGGTPLANESGPDKWQKEFLRAVGKELEKGGEHGAVIKQACKAAHGVGKALPYSTIVPTPAGYREWGSVQIGDRLFAEDGEPTRVVNRYDQPAQSIYRVIFDDGSSALASADHLWKVKGYQERRKHLDWRVVSTEDLLRIGLHRSNGNATARQWCIPAQGAAHYPSVSLPMDPYLLGMWIGNGSGARICQPLDPDLQAWASASVITRRPDNGQNSETWTIPSEPLRALDIFDRRSWEKFIPIPAKLGDIEQRTALLAGLMDTDGTIGKDNGSAGYDTTSQRLANDVCELVRSLGGKATIQTAVKRPFYRDDTGERVMCRPCWRVTVRTAFNPFRRGAKAIRWRPCEPRYLTRWIDSIEYSHEERAHCVEVEHDSHCYLTENYIVTHNTAVIGWICDWGISTHPYTRGTVSAMTEPQLRTKTWAEVAKWHSMCITAPLFRISGRELTLNVKDQTKLRTWRFDAVAWNKADPSAYAGLHNKNRRVIIIYDECAEIVDSIWEVSEGALTDADTQIMWFAFGQPLKTNGKFYHCFQPKTSWKTYTVSGLDSKFTNKAQIESWKKEYGEDSDFYRVRALGQFPRYGLNNFISPETVMNAQNRMHHPNSIERYPKIMGLDPAAFGDNFSVLTIRQGPALVLQKSWSGLDGPDLASRVVDEWHRHRNTVECCVDVIGIGQSVCDALARVPGFPLTPINVSMPASEAATYHNMRAQLWAKMRKWLEDQGALPADDDLAIQLTSLDYGFDGKSRYQMESKQDMKEQGKKSPDKADSLALTFVPDSILRVPARMAHARTVERRVRVL